MKFSYLIFVLIAINVQVLHGQSNIDTTYFIKQAVDLDGNQYDLKDLIQPIAYDSHCIDGADPFDRNPQEGILELANIRDSVWRLKGVVMLTCNSADTLFPKMSWAKDTLKVDWLPVYNIKVTESKPVDDIGTIIYELLEDYEECMCTFSISMGFYAQNIGTLLMNERELPKIESIYRTFEVKYFIHQGDTIGYIDKYGRRQGSLIRKTAKNGFQARTVYKDGRHIRYEIYAPDGERIFADEDIDKYFDKWKPLGL